MAQEMSNIYSEARIYDIIFGEPASEQDLEFYRTLIHRFGGPVLELACGTGRITIPLAQMGFEIAGLDLSPAMIQLARQKSQEASLHISFYNADMRDFSIDRRFGFIFVPNQSFQHLYQRKDVAECLQSVRDHLLPDGAFLIQVFNPYPPVLTVEPKRMKTSKEFYVDEVSGERYYAELQNTYDMATQVTHAVYYYHTESDSMEKTFTLSLRQFFPQELDALIEYNGFEIIAKYGDNRFTPFIEKPYYQNILCRPK